MLAANNVHAPAGPVGVVGYQDRGIVEGRVPRHLQESEQVRSARGPAVRIGERRVRKHLGKVEPPRSPREASSGVVHRMLPAMSTGMSLDTGAL